MTTEGPKVVWILGAGFSQPLGGPLLGRLLSPGSFRDLEKRYDNRLIDNAARWACHICQYGQGFPNGSVIENNLPGENLWEDAEEFLEVLDSAESQSLAKNQVNRIVEHMRTRERSDGWNFLPADGFDVPEMRLAARKLVAAECSTFANDARLGAEHDESVVPERWSAHVDWLKQLDGQHTLVTFNYDRAIERMSRHFEKKRSDGFKALLPGDSPSSPPLILKLHGSVDWLLSDDEGIKRESGEFFLAAKEHQLVIATPGPTKTKVTRTLEPLWKLAEDALKNAQAIVFVGYRFPPTDAIARKVLLGAIAANKDVVKLGLHIVLGPDLAHRDVVRLRGLLDSMARRAGRRSIEHYRAEPGYHDRTYQITTHPMWSQDFFSVWTHDGL